MDIRSIRAKFEARGYVTHTADTVADARSVVLSLIPDGASVGIGGSASIQTLDILDGITAKGGKYEWHWLVPPEDRPALFPRAAACDVYLLSANAVTSDARIVNIDGNGNRLSGSFFGPKTVVFVIGKNKLTDGGLDDAIARIKNTACPLNARRLGLKTPCAATGRCSDCNSPQRMCKAVLTLERPTSGKNVHVVLVDEDLGF